VFQLPDGDIYNSGLFALLKKTLTNIILIGNPFPILHYPYQAFYKMFFMPIFHIQPHRARKTTIHLSTKIQLYRLVTVADNIRCNGGLNPTSGTS
jgi:hypothetical protein